MQMVENFLVAAFVKTAMKCYKAIKKRNRCRDNILPLTVDTTPESKIKLG